MIGAKRIALEWAEWALQGAADLSLAWISKPLAAGARACRIRLAALRNASPPENSTHAR